MWTIHFGQPRLHGSIFPTGITWIGSDTIISLNTRGFIMGTLAGFTHPERVLTTTGSIFRNTDGCGRTGIRFLFSTHQPIRIGINTIYRMLSLGGSKDIRIKHGIAGAGFTIVEFPFCGKPVFGSDIGNFSVFEKKNQILLTKLAEGDVFEIFLSFFEVVL